MHTLNVQKTGLTLGAALGLFHFAWALLVLSGYAQTFYDYVLWAHMIHLPLTIGPFELNAAVTLVILTAVMGYVMGIVFAWVWNKFHR